MPKAGSPPTARVLDVLELLAQHARAGTSPRLSDLVRDLGLTQATAHAIMATLCDRGWAIRDPGRRTFALGPALAALAARGATEPSPRQAARAAVHDLAKRLGYPAAVTERVGDELVITTIDLGPCQRSEVEAGDRLPFAAPFGDVFAAWADPEGRRAWMHRGAITSPALMDRLDRMLTATRERGYSISRMEPATAQATRAVTVLRHDPATQPLRRLVDGLLTELAGLDLPPTGAGLSPTGPGVPPAGLGGHPTGAGPGSGGRPDDDPRPVTAISAPVFDPRTGQVTASVGVHPLRALSPARADEIGGHVTRATATLNAAAGDVAGTDVARGGGRGGAAAVGDVGEVGRPHPDQ